MPIHAGFCVGTLEGVIASRVDVGLISSHGTDEKKKGDEHENIDGHSVHMQGDSN